MRPSAAPLLLVALLVLALVLLAGCAPTAPPPQQHPEAQAVLQKQVELGVEYLRRGDYRRARDKLNRALEIDPGSGAAHTAFGLLFQLEGDHELAEKHFKAAIRHAPDLTQARNNYGAFLFSRQRYREAVDQLQAASEDRLYENRPAVFENLGVAYGRIGNGADAERAFLQATRLNPGQARALLELAEIRFGQRNYVEAMDLYRRHARVASHSPRSLWLCVRVSRILGDEDEELGCGLALESAYPASEERKMYLEAL